MCSVILFKLAGKPQIEEKFNEYQSSTSKIIVKPLGFNNLVNEIEFEVCSNTKEDFHKKECCPMKMKMFLIVFLKN